MLSQRAAALLRSAVAHFEKRSGRFVGKSECMVRRFVASEK
jgi:hypothetical protein